MEIEYWSTADSEFHPLELQLAGAVATLHLASNEAQPERRAVGVFQREIAALSIAPIEHAVSVPAFADLPEPDGVAPGSVLRRITVSTSEGTTEKYAAEGEPTPAPFATVEELLLAIVELVSSEPIHAVTVDLGSELRRTTEGLRVSIRITSVGRRGVVLRHPDEWANAGVAAVLRIVSDAPSDDSEVEGQWFVDLTHGQVIGGPGDSSRPMVPLAAGEALEVAFSAPDELPGGAYEVQLSVSTPLAGLSGTELIQCAGFSIPKRIRL